MQRQQHLCRYCGDILSSHVRNFSRYNVYVYGIVNLRRFIRITTMKSLLTREFACPGVWQLCSLFVLTRSHSSRGSWRWSSGVCRPPRVESETEVLDPAVIARVISRTAAVIIKELLGIFSKYCIQLQANCILMTMSLVCALGLGFSLTQEKRKLLTRFSDFQLVSLVRHDYERVNESIGSLLTPKPTTRGVSTAGEGGTRPSRIWWGGNAHVFVPQISLNDSRGHPFGKI
jgi:hypothetical protein